MTSQWPIDVPGASSQEHEFVRDKALEFLGALKDSDVSLFRLFIPLLVLLFCVLCGFLLLALILVLLTAFISHYRSPSLQARSSSSRRQL